MAEAGRCYFLTAPRGFEFLATEEIGEALPAARIEPRRGEGLVRTNASPEPADPGAGLFSLRSCYHVYAFAAERDDLPLDASGLDQLKRLARETDWAPALSMWRERFGRAAPRSFRITAQRSGDHAYSSMQAAAALGEAMQQRFGWPVNLNEPDVEVYAHLHEASVWLGLALTPQGLHDREPLERGRTGLKQPIAHGLGRLARLKPGEVTLDPMAGVGTLPIEAATLQPRARHLAGEREARDLQRAITNRARTGRRFDLLQWDARQLPLTDACIDAILCDLPFGVRVGSHRRNVHLYPRVLGEMARVLKPGGRAVLLSLERRLIERRIEKSQSWRCEARCPVHYGGLDPKVYVLRRRPVA